jgi:hypothetical protein
LNKSDATLASQSAIPMDSGPRTEATTMGARKRTTEWVFILRAKVYNRPLRITVLPSDAGVVGCVAVTRAKLINIWFGGPLPAISGIQSGRPFLRI